MKKRLVNTKRVFASPISTKSIHDQIEETIAERKRILTEWERLFAIDNINQQKDIHAQLRETISAFKRSMKQHERFFISIQKNNRAA